MATGEASDPLVKRYYGPRGHGTNVGHVPVGEDEGEYTPTAPDATPEFERAAAFHEAVAELPTEEREVVGLTYYHAWTQSAIADLFGVSVRTVQRWLDSAVVKLKLRVGDV